MLDELSIITKRYIYPAGVRDLFFLGGSPAMAYMRAKGMIRSFRGGSTIQQQFLWNGVHTSAYKMGTEFTPTRSQIIASNNFYPKLYVALMLEQLENLEITQGDPALSIANTLGIQAGASVSSLSARLGVEFYRHGQNVTSAGNYGATVEDRSLNINGVVEALNDGVTPGPDGNVWPYYGGQLRSEVGAAMNSIPRWMGTIAGAPQLLSFNELKALTVGGGASGPMIAGQQPDLVLMSKSVYTGIEVILEGKQVIASAVDPYWGTIGGIKFGNALLTVDEYIPSIYGQDTIYGNFSTSGVNRALPAAGAAYTAISSEFATTKPNASAALYTGEVIVALNSDTWIFDLSASPLFSMGFTGWMTSPLSTRVVGRVHLAGNMRCLEPRLNRIGYGLAPPF